MSNQSCPTCGKDMISVCPICGKKVDVYSRIVGYLRPTSNWNPGKQEEFRHRKEFVLGEGWRDKNVPE